MLSPKAGPILREADRRSPLGSHPLVVGTNAMAAYSLEMAGAFIGVPDETVDFDLASAAGEFEAGAQVRDILKAADSAFAINSELDFQARNAKA